MLYTAMRRLFIYLSVLRHIFISNCQSYIKCVMGVNRHCQHHFSYNVVASFDGGRNCGTQTPISSPLPQSVAFLWQTVVHEVVSCTLVGIKLTDRHWHWIYGPEGPILIFGNVRYICIYFNLTWILQSDWLICLENNLIILDNLGWYCDVTTIFQIQIVPWNKRN
jgi:hypothetical protein